MVHSGDSAALRQVAARAESNPAWHGYGHYCRLRAQGLRKAALQQLNIFLVHAGDWDFERRREFVEWLCRNIYQLDWHSYHPALTPLLATPLTRQLLRPTLEEWIQNEPGSVAAQRWAGIFLKEPDHLRSALDLDPTEQIARIELVAAIIRDVALDQHHLPDYYIGDAARDIWLAQEASRYCRGIADKDLRAHVLGRIEHLEQVAKDWLRVRASHEQQPAHAPASDPVAGDAPNDQAIHDYVEAMAGTPADLDLELEAASEEFIDREE